MYAEIESSFGKAESRRAGVVDYPVMYERHTWYTMYRAENISLYVVARMLKASSGRSGKQQQE